MNHYLIYRKIISLLFREYYVNNNSEYSTEQEWISLIKKSKFNNRSLLASKILNFKERKWNKENILLSDVNLSYKN